MGSPDERREKVLAEAKLVEAAVRAAGRDALIFHKKIGNPIAVW